MDLHDALTQISEIRRQVARTEVFRGYRAAPVAFSGLLAILAAMYQNSTMATPAQNIEAYLALWVGAAILSILVMGAALFLYWWQYPTPMTRTTTRLAVSQFTPAIVVGGILAFVLWRSAPPESLWMLPGLWAILFGLGIFASYRLLPAATFWLGVYYVGAGVLCLAWAQGEHAFSPWAMGGTFGVGQLASAVVLYWTLERPHAEES